MVRSRRNKKQNVPLSPLLFFILFVPLCRNENTMSLTDIIRTESGWNKLIFPYVTCVNLYDVIVVTPDEPAIQTATPALTATYCYSLQLDSDCRFNVPFIFCQVVTFNFFYTLYHLNRRIFFNLRNTNTFIFILFIKYHLSKLKR